MKSQQERHLLVLPFTSLATVRAAFPEASRAELWELLRRYRKEYVIGKKYFLHELLWRRPGAVWAADYCDPPRPVDGAFRQILAVRDLSSGCCLLWLPVREKSGQAVRDALGALFMRHGAPLVLKTDNDSTLKEEGVLDLLGAWGVTPLLSPPRFPPYNGAVESGIGTLKAFAHHQAARCGRAGEWSCDEKKLSVEAFKEVREASDGKFGKREAALAERTAIARALLETGILEIRRSGISSPIKFKNCSRIMR